MASGVTCSAREQKIKGYDNNYKRIWATWCGASGRWRARTRHLWRGLKGVKKAATVATCYKKSLGPFHHPDGARDGLWKQLRLGRGWWGLFAEWRDEKKKIKKTPALRGVRPSGIWVARAWTRDRLHPVPAHRPACEGVVASGGDKCRGIHVELYLFASLFSTPTFFFALSFEQQNARPPGIGVRDPRLRASLVECEKKMFGLLCSHLLEQLWHL